MQNGVSQDIINLNLFPFSLTHEAESWFYHLKTHSIHAWEMLLKFLSKYYPHSRALQLRKNILNFWQLPLESVFEAWERFKSCLRKCPDHRILILNQIITFYHGIIMIDQDKIMAAARGNIMRKTPQEVYDLIENMTQHNFQWTPTPSSNPIVESLSPLPTPFEDIDSLLEETDTLLESSGSTITHSDFSLPEYDSFIFDLLIVPLPPAYRSDLYHEEFADELTHIIPPPEYDYFYFDLETDPREFTSVVEKNIFDLSSTKDSTSIELNDTLLLSDCDSSLSKEFSEINLLVSFPSRNEDIIFDSEIFIIKGFQSQRFHILLLDDFYSIAFVSAPLFLTDPLEIETFLPFLAENEDKVFDPMILFINGVFSFIRKTPHLLNDNFLIDKCHSFSGISMMTESSVSCCLKDKGIRGESS
nr:hypothetical protein [Tanacetum cinerariifolium]